MYRGLELVSDEREEQQRALLFMLNSFIISSPQIASPAGTGPLAVPSVHRYGALR